MKKVSALFTALLLLFLVLVMSELGYGGRRDKSGTSAAPELLIPVGGRDIALGGSSLATTTGIDAIYWNPAGLARSSHSTEALFTHMSYIADIGVDYLAVGAVFEGFGSIGFSLKSLSMGDVEITTTDVPDGTGETFSPTFVTIGLTYSRLLTDRISVGVTTNLISEQIDRVSATGIGFNVGLQYSQFAGFTGLNIGVAVKNIGPAMKFDGPGLLQEATVIDFLRPASFYKVEAATDELPSVIEIGVGYSYKFQEQHVATVSGLFQNNNLSSDEYKAGLEYGYDNMFFIRGGFNLAAEDVDNAYLFGATVGAGVNLDLEGIAVAVDYAYRDAQFFEGNHVVGLRLGF